MPKSLCHLFRVVWTFQKHHTRGCRHANSVGRKNQRPGTHGANILQHFQAHFPILPGLLPEAFATPLSSHSLLKLSELWKSLLTDFFQSRKFWSQSVQKINRQVLTANGDRAEGVTSL